MKNIYLVLAIIGFIVPNYFVALESIENGNILLYTNVISTFESMFANRISAIFALDLLLAVPVFFIWSYRESKTHGIKNIYGIWMVTMLFGLAGALPLFLYLKEKRK